MTSLHLSLITNDNYVKVSNFYIIYKEQSVFPNVNRKLDAHVIFALFLICQIINL